MKKNIKESGVGKACAKVKELQEQIKLKENTGEELYNELTKEQRKFIIEVDGSINLGEGVDVENLDKILNNKD